MTNLRWHVVMWYRTDSGLLDVHHDIEELVEIDSLVERGPHWDALDYVEITRNLADSAKITVEQAARIGESVG